MSWLFAQVLVCALGLEDFFFLLLGFKNSLLKKIFLKKSSLYILDSMYGLQIFSPSRFYSFTFKSIILFFSFLRCNWRLTLY